MLVVDTVDLKKLDINSAGVNIRVAPDIRPFLITGWPDIRLEQTVLNSKQKTNKITTKPLEVQLETISLIISFIILCRMQNCGITIYSMNSNFISCFYI